MAWLMVELKLLLLPQSLILWMVGTSAGTTAVAAGDGIVTNDGGTMRQTTAATFSTYFNANLVEVQLH